MCSCWSPTARSSGVSGPVQYHAHLLSSPGILCQSHTVTLPHSEQPWTLWIAPGVGSLTRCGGTQPSLSAPSHRASGGSRCRRRVATLNNGGRPGEPHKSTAGAGPSKAQRGACTVAIARVVVHAGTEAAALQACPCVSRHAMGVVLPRERRRFLRNLQARPRWTSGHMNLRAYVQVNISDRPEVLKWNGRGWSPRRRCCK